VVYDDAKAIDNGHIGPFAVHNRSVYFILQRHEQPNFRTRLNVIELRRMTAHCKDGSAVPTPVTASRLYILYYTLSIVIIIIISSSSSSRCCCCCCCCCISVWNEDDWTKHRSLPPVATSNYSSVLTSSLTSSARCTRPTGRRTRRWTTCFSSG